MKRKIGMSFLAACALFCLSFGFASCEPADSSSSSEESSQSSSQEQPQNSAYDFIFDETLNGYVVTGVSDAFTGTKIEVPDTYNDGVNGNRKVVAVQSQAFKDMTEITEAVLPETVTKITAGDFEGNDIGGIFAECSALEFVSAVGITTFDGVFNFKNCLQLKTVIVNADVIMYKTQFYVSSKYSGEYTRRLSVYINGRTRGDHYYLRDIVTSTQNMLNGKVYYYNPSGGCETWEYGTDGKPVLSEEHDYQGGECMRCGGIDPAGIEYFYNLEYDSYFINGLLPTFTGTSVRPLAGFDDGTHGYKNVIAVARDAFADNPTITEVVLPDTVTAIWGNDGNLFRNCYALEYVSLGSLKGFVNFDGTRAGGNNFLNCISLQQVMVVPNFRQDHQQFYVQDHFPDYVRQVEVFVKGEDRGENFRMGNLAGYNNNMFKGELEDYVPHVYTYSKEEKAGCWHYENDDPSKRPVKW